MKNQGNQSHLGLRSGRDTGAFSNFNQQQMLLSLRPRTIKFKSQHSRVIQLLIQFD